MGLVGPSLQLSVSVRKLKGGDTSHFQLVRSKCGTEENVTSETELNDAQVQMLHFLTAVDVFMMIRFSSDPVMLFTVPDILTFNFLFCPATHLIHSF